MSTSKEKIIKFENKSGSTEELRQDSFSKNNESKFQSSSDNDMDFNSSNESDSYIFINQGDSFDNKKIINFFNNKIGPNKNKNVVEVNRDKNDKEFFIKAKGHDLCFYKVHKHTKIKDVIENYIQNENLDNNIKHNFIYDNRPIENLENTLDDLEIATLGIITTK